jgi:crotonobetainyl-CoA:carnitine CoA-transferase CaiB-like acyl-CoA transferase
VVARLDQAQIANARVNTMHDVWEHPQLRARNRWREVGTPAGAVPALLPPGSWEEGEPRFDPVPALGEHTASILARLGYSPSRIAELRAEKAI